MKRFLSVLLSCLLIFCTFFAVPYTEAPFIVFSSAVEDSLLFEYNSNTKSYCVVGLADEGVTEITIPGTYNDNPVTAIADEAFLESASLVKVTISENVTRIGESAFKSCASLEEVVFNTNSAQIGEKAFLFCRKLAKVSFTENSVIDIGTAAFQSCSALEKLSLPEGLVSIGVSVFTNCSALNEVWVPSTITSIGGGAFGNCENLETAHITSIGSWCNVSLVSADSSPVAWATNVYVNGQLLGEEMVIPSGVEEIKAYCFYSLTGVKNVYLSETVKTIGDYAFAQSGIEKITLNEGLESLGERSFYGSKILEINIPSSVHSIGSESFSLTTLDKINIASIESWCNIDFADEQANPVSCGNAYVDGTLLTELTIPEGVEEIKPYAFACFGSLISVVIPSTVKTINKYAFARCYGLTQITIPEGVGVIKAGAFYECYKLTDITINTSTATMEENVFYNCNKLVNIHVPSLSTWCGLTFPTSKANPLTSGKKLYVDGELQTAIKIPEGVKVIKKNNLSGYSEITSVYLPSTVSNIEAGAFAECPNITSVDINAQNQWYCAEDNVLYTKSKQRLIYSPATKAHTRFVVDEAVLYIEEYAFYKNTSLVELVLPAGLKSIGAYATNYCSNLKYVFFLGTQAQWSGVTIKTPSIITSAYMHFGTDEHTESDNWEFASGCSCTNGKESHINKVCKYCDYAFDFQVVPPGHAYVDNVCKYCGDTEFEYEVNNYGETTITKYNGKDAYVKIPERIDGYFVSLIGSEAFEDNDELVVVYIPDRVFGIDDGAFSNCDNLVEITGAQGVVQIGDKAFSNCRKLQRYPFGSKLKSIGEYSFASCESLTNADLPDSVYFIGEYAFSYCTSIKHFTVPQGVEILEREIFNRVSLETFTVGSNVKEIKGNGLSVFYSVDTLYIKDLSAWFEVTFERGANPVIKAKNLNVEGKSARDLVIPKDVETIPAYAFEDCSCIESVTVTSSTQTIASHAFDNCNKLKSIVLQEGVKTIGDYAFLNCKMLENVEMADSVIYLYAGAFKGCTSLEKIDLPASITNVETYTFQDCTSLKSVTMPEGVGTIQNSAFKGCTSLESIDLTNCSDLYSCALMDCTSLKTVKLSPKMRTINSDIFNGCTSLEEIHLPNELTTISNRTFANCTSLKDVYIYKKLNTIYSDSFENSGVVNVFFTGTESSWDIKTTSSPELKSAYIHYESTTHSPSDFWILDENFVCGSEETFYKYRTCKYCPMEYEREVMDSGHAMQNHVSAVDFRSLQIPFQRTVKQQ